MAKKGGTKEVYANESTVNMISEQRVRDGSKQKIASIQEVFPSATREQVTKVLAFCNGDVGEAINAFTSDGGREAMTHSIEVDNPKSKVNKPKKKKKNKKKEIGSGITPSASFDADDSSSLHSSSNIDLEVEKDCPKTESEDCVTPEILGEIKNVEVRLEDPEKLKEAPAEHFPKEQAKCQTETDAKPVKEAHGHHAAEEHSLNQEVMGNTCSNPRDECSLGGSPESDYSEKQDKIGQRKENFRSNREESHSKFLNRQRTGSFHRSKASFSEDYPSQPTSQQASALSKGRGYEKCKKDLSRQSTSLQRIQNQLEKGLEDSSKRLKNSFLEIRKILDKRQELMEQEMERTKQEALNLLKSRQELAIELKRRVDRTSFLSEADWSDLRSDIKQYVTERKYDEELANPAWFSWSMEAVTESLNNFGEVRPVKNVYSQRSQMLLGNTNNVEPSPLSVTNVEFNSMSDKNDNNISEVIQTVTSPEKDVRPPFRNQAQGENRNTRVYSNSNYPNQGNRGRRYNAGRGQSRGNYGSYNKNYSSYGNNYNSYDHQGDYRNHHMPNRSRPFPRPDPQNEATKSSPYPNDRNMSNVPNDSRNNERNHSGRGQHNMTFRQSLNRNQPNMGPRSNAENSSKPVASSPDNSKENAKTEKTSAVNGY